MPQTNDQKMQTAGRMQAFYLYSAARDVISKTLGEGGVGGKI
jgi:hypothetical protein